MPSLIKDWKKKLSECLHGTGFISGEYSGKLLITVNQGNILAVEVAQTVK